MQRERWHKTLGQVWSAGIKRLHTGPPGKQNRLIGLWHCSDRKSIPILTRLVPLNQLILFANQVNVDVAVSSAFADVFDVQLRT